MTKEKKKPIKKDEPEALFIPAGCLIGIGFGFLYNHIIAGLFIGLGLGFTIFAFLLNMKKNK